MSARKGSRRPEGEAGRRDHFTTVTVERRENVDRYGTVRRRTERHRGQCRGCSWQGPCRQRKDAAERDAAKHERDAAGEPCGACGNPPGMHPRKGCARWEFPGQLELLAVPA